VCSELQAACRSGCSHGRGGGGVSNHPSSAWAADYFMSCCPGRLELSIGRQADKHCGGLVGAGPCGASGGLVVWGGGKGGRGGGTTTLLTALAKRSYAAERQRQHCPGHTTLLSGQVFGQVLVDYKSQLCIFRPVKVLTASCICTSVPRYSCCTLPCRS
jgi:hypothetical protein